MQIRITKIITFQDRQHEDDNKEYVQHTNILITHSNNRNVHLIYVATYVSLNDNEYDIHNYTSGNKRADYDSIHFHCLQNIELKSQGIPHY